MHDSTRSTSASLLLAALSLLPACAFLGDGDAVTEEREISSFTRVASTTTVDVEITVDDGNAEALSVTCDGNLLDDIETYVDGDTLRIETENGVSLRPRARCVAEIRARHLKAVDVTGSGDLLVIGRAPELAELRTSGSGEIVADDLAAPVIDARSSGSGDVVLRGEAVDVTLESSGSGEIVAADLVAEAAHAESTGSGGISLFASVLVYARASGSGDIIVLGEPENRNVESSGSGSVIVR
jgi:hypothetical protein